MTYRGRLSPRKAKVRQKGLCVPQPHDVGWWLSSSTDANAMPNQVIINVQPDILYQRERRRERQSSDGFGDWISDGGRLENLYRVVYSPSRIAGGRDRHGRGAPCRLGVRALVITRRPVSAGQLISSPWQPFGVRFLRTAHRCQQMLRVSLRHGGPHTPLSGP